MKKIVCDVCKKKEGKTIKFCVGQRRIGLESEDDWQSIDICCDCLIEKLETFLNIKLKKNPPFAWQFGSEFYGFLNK